MSPGLAAALLLRKADISEVSAAWICSGVLSLESFGPFAFRLERKLTYCLTRSLNVLIVALSAGETTGSSAAVICFTTFSWAFMLGGIVAKQTITNAATKAVGSGYTCFMPSKNCKHDASQSFP